MKIADSCQQTVLANSPYSVSVVIADQIVAAIDAAQSGKGSIIEACTHPDP